MADRASAVKWLSGQLSRQERQVLAVQAELESSPMLSRWDDPRFDGGAVLDPVLLAIRHAAFVVGAVPVPRPRRGAVEALLSVIWSDLIDLEPGELRSGGVCMTFRRHGPRNRLGSSRQWSRPGTGCASPDCPAR